MVELLQKIGKHCWKTRQNHEKVLHYKKWRQLFTWKHRKTLQNGGIYEGFKEFKNS